jgi:hypothetical protein
MIQIWGFFAAILRQIVNHNISDVLVNARIPTIRGTALSGLEYLIVKLNLWHLMNSHYHLSLNITAKASLCHGAPTESSELRKNPGFAGAFSRVKYPT